ncbi:MAG: DNA-protecting protein DprA [Ruminococcaceae bacterium]|nr:DNA-protecting protein DprA [Oscillospiraceae bacterium]
MKDRLFEIWFSLRVGVANPAFMPLLEQYTPYELFSMGGELLESLPCDDRLKRALEDKNLEESHRIQRYCQNNGVGLLFWQDENYPSVLRMLKDPPLLLYYRGKLPDFKRELCISVVGTRTMSEYGKRMAYKIGYELAAVGTVVVSGLALGVDAVASAGAIAAEGRTVAVLGCGIDVAYPVAHKPLMEAVVRQGAVMTEYPPATRPLGHHFPQRNRIISGLSQGTVVVEAGLGSGALITAKTAISQGRDIFAVPGNVGDENTSGTNQLISEGATVVLKPSDILNNYSFLYRDVLRMKALPAAERHSDLNDAVLARLSVYVKKAEEKKDASSKPQNPPSSSGRAKEAAPSPQLQRKNPPKDSSLVSRKPDAETAHKMVPPSAPRKGDLSEQTLMSLSETQRKLFNALPLDHAVAVDYLMKEGFSMSEIMSSMTMLEIKGLVVALPGGLYSRK